MFSEGAFYVEHLKDEPPSPRSAKKISFRVYDRALNGRRIISPDLVQSVNPSTGLRSFTNRPELVQIFGLPVRN